MNPSPSRDTVFTDILWHYASLPSMAEREAYLDWLTCRLFELRIKFDQDKEYML